MVPNLKSMSSPAAATTVCASASSSLRVSMSSFTCPTSGIIDLRAWLLAGTLHCHGGVEDGARLDLDEVRGDQTEATAAKTQHRVLLVHRPDGREQLLVLRGRRVPRLGHLDQLVLEVGQELVQRRVDEPDDDGQPVHGREDALEVALLEDLELGHGAVEGSHGV